jgi:hypothetical protein
VAGAELVGVLGADATGFTAGEIAGCGCLTGVASSDACEISRVSGSCAAVLDTASLALPVLATLTAVEPAGAAIGGTLLKRIAPTAL